MNYLAKDAFLESVQYYYSVSALKNDFYDLNSFVPKAD